MPEPFSAKLFAKATAQALLGLPRPTDVAAAALYLAGPQAARIPGDCVRMSSMIASRT
jgi:transcription initiation factor TFIIIB Brf1 subunit/transcription initiation factor TFIIB